MTTIEYLQREIRRVELSIRRAERKPNAPAEELRGLHEKLEHLQEALEAVNEHWQRVHEQRGWTTGEPLTAEQLRGMDGRPVWVNLIKPTQGECEGWAIVYKDNGSTAVQRWTTCALRYEDYGEIWIAYAYPPAHIDREKWEPCMWCVLNGQFGLNNYCSSCGRPLTDEAWAELERRVCGG